MKRVMFLMVVTILAGCSMPTIEQEDFRVLNTSSKDFQGSVGGIRISIPTGEYADVQTVAEVSYGVSSVTVIYGSKKVIVEYPKGESRTLVIADDTAFDGEICFVAVVAPHYDGRHAIRVHPGY